MFLLYLCKFDHPCSIAARFGSPTSTTKVMLHTAVSLRCECRNEMHSANALCHVLAKTEHQYWRMLYCFVDLCWPAHICRASGPSKTPLSFSVYDQTCKERKCVWSCCVSIAWLVALSSEGSSIDFPFFVGHAWYAGCLHNERWSTIGAIMYFERVRDSRPRDLSMSLSLVITALSITHTVSSKCQSFLILRRQWLRHSFVQSPLIGCSWVFGLQTLSFSMCRSWQRELLGIAQMSCVDFPISARYGAMCGGA